MTSCPGRATYFLGFGRLAESIASALGSVGPFTHLTSMDVDSPCFSAPGGVLVSAYDTWDASRDSAIGKAVGRAQLIWLPVRTELDTIVIGPVSSPGRAGCFVCAETRRQRTTRDSARRRALQERFRDKLASTRPSTLTVLAADVAAAVAVNGVLGLEPGWLLAGCALAVLDCATLTLRRHHFLPDPACHACGCLPADDRERAWVTLEPSPKVRPHTPRVRDLVAELDELTQTYVDDEVGVVRELRLVSLGTFPMVEAPVGLPGRERPEAGYGRSFDVRNGKSTALAEALERLGGWVPGGKRTVIRGTYRELQDDALGPRKVGLYPSDRIAESNSRFQAYHDDLPLTWVWAYSFQCGRPILVPESLAYYGLPQAREGSDRPFVYEVSNGCALGSCLEEAILFGALEVAERDGFLMTWLTHMGVPRIDPRSARDPMIPLMTERLLFTTGYDIAIFNTTMEQGIPSFWVMAVEQRGDGQRPRTISTGGSNPDPERAVMNALHELAPIIDALPRSYAANRALAHEMVTDPFAVTDMAHHLLVYADPDTFERFNFLFASHARYAFADFHELWAWPNHMDVRGDTQEIVARYLQSGLDVIVVNQTGPVQRHGGFVCVKVIVPGAVPMTFGHRHRRVDGLARLLSVPAQLGYRDAPLTVSDLNPHPHPFP